MRLIKLVTLSVAAALFVISCEQPSTNTTTNSAANRTATANSAPANTAAVTPSPASTLDELASGRDLYTKYCSRCHKDDGTGGPVEIEGKKLKPDNLTSDKIAAFSDDKIAGYIKDGVPDEGMPAFKDRLTDEQIGDVIAYVRKELQKK